MSRKYVRDTVRGWITSNPPAIPFYETINVDENPTDPTWLTVEFNAEYTDQQGFCGHQEERGVIELVISGAPGVGDGVVISAADALAQQFMNNKDPSGKLTLLNDLAPEEFSGGDANKYYQVIVGIEYQYLFD